MGVTGSVPPPAGVGARAGRRPAIWSLIAGLEAALALAGPFLLAEGLLRRQGTPIAEGFGLVALAVGLFLWEARRAPLPPSLGSGTALAARGRPWWTHRTPWVGRYLCVACGFRQEEPATFCPRCGKPLVRLPPVRRPGTGPEDGGAGP